jgi:purine-binding chemotaxis protein CheW
MSARAAIDRDELERRARALARPPVEPAPETGRLDVVIVDLGSERRAIAAAHVLEVVPAGPLTPVPGTPGFLLGLASRRGRVLPVVDLAPVVGLAGDAGGAGLVVAVEAEGMTFGIAAGAVEGPLRAREEELAARLVPLLDVPAVAAGLVVDDAG